jgi:hypothetical protein
MTIVFFSYCPSKVDGYHVGVMDAKVVYLFLSCGIQLTTLDNEYFALEEGMFNSMCSQPCDENLTNVVCSFGCIFFHVQHNGATKCNTM